MEGLIGSVGATQVSRGRDFRSSRPTLSASAAPAYLGEAEKLIPASLPSAERGQRVQCTAKRLTDMVVATLALVLLTPVFLVVAIAVKLTSRGPILYRQRRLMQGCEAFTMYKFRTMIDGADALLDQVSGLNEASGPLFKTRSDPRVTRLGRFLRRNYLDELPQLINVIRGEMSLVGPRPCLASEVASELDVAAFRFAVPQGVTGPWQTNGHHSVSSEQRLSLERQYIDSWSYVADVLILIRTVPLIVRRTGF